jgi:predicted nuclease of restriction endonuclease-like (RecB) superfamily
MAENKEYIKFLNDLKSKIKQAQYQAYRAVNKELISLYWDIGKSIVEKQEKLGWGQKIIQQLAEDLQKEFPQNSGFSERNLKYMRRLYIEYKDKPKVQPLVAQIPWSHNLILLDKTKSDYEKEYYCRMVLKYSWSKRILAHQIESKSFERFLTDKKSHNFDKTLPVKMLKKVKPTIKDSYLLDFLEISEDIKEKELERKLLENIKKPVGVAKYYLTRKLPAKLLKQLPSPSVIEDKLKELEEKKE